MRRSSLIAGLVVLAIAIAGAMAATRVGPSPVDGVLLPLARSSAWFCAHGGGKEWEGSLALANPGSVAVQARVTSLGSKRPAQPQTVMVPPGREVLRPLVAGERGSSTFVEVFGGYLGVGWMVRAGGDESGMGAEPCADAAATTWSSIDLGTLEGEEGFLIVMNPFASQAVFDVALFSPDASPLRDPDWTDVRLAPGRSAAFDVAVKVPGKDAVSATVEVSSGRVAAATLSLGNDGGVRSALAAPTQASRWYLPVVEGSGQGTLLIGVTNDAPVRFDAVLRSEGPPQPAGGLLGVRQGALTTAVYPVTSTGPSMIEVSTHDDVAVIAALRASGEATDAAATGGATTPATAWVVLPTAAEQPWFPGLVVANPGDVAVEVSVRMLPSAEGLEATEATFTIDAGTVASPPKGFLTSDPRGAVLVEASGPVVALGGSTSSGLEGRAWYALAMGVAVPSWALAEPSLAP